MFRLHFKYYFRNTFNLSNNNVRESASHYQELAYLISLHIISIDNANGYFSIVLCDKILMYYCEC